jgi:antiviral helicase SKI2
MREAPCADLLPVSISPRSTPLPQVVFEWARGTPFDQICLLTDVMEGSIVRTVVRLDQACREFMDAARVMGNTTLFQQMQAASAAIKRDVVFAASLYVA